MGAKQSKRSVDISGKEADGAGEVAAAGAGGEGRVEALADADVKPQLNGDAHITETTEKEKQIDNGTAENEKDATTEKENKEQDEEKKEAPVTNGDTEPKPESGETPSPEDNKKPKKEKVKKKWSLRSISFSRKDKPKQEKKQKDEDKTNGEPEKVPEESAETVAETEKNEAAPETTTPEAKEDKTPETPVTEPLTNGSSTPETPKVETPAEKTVEPKTEIAKPEAKVEPEQLPVNGLSLEETPKNDSESDKTESSKPEEIKAEPIVPATEIPVKNEVCVEQMPLIEPTPPPLPATPPPSSVASFAATTMAPELTDASLANTAHVVPDTTAVPDTNTDTEIVNFAPEPTFTPKEVTEDNETIKETTVVPDSCPLEEEKNGDETSAQTTEPEKLNNHEDTEIHENEKPCLITDNDKEAEILPPPPEEKETDILPPPPAELVNDNSIDNAEDNKDDEIKNEVPTEIKASENDYTDIENLKNKAKDLQINSVAAPEQNGDIEIEPVVMNGDSEVDGHTDSPKPVATPEDSMPPSLSETMESLPPQGGDFASNDVSESFPEPPSDNNCPSETEITQPGTPERNGEAPSDPTQDTLLTSDKMADLIPEVPVIPELNSESVTATDVEVAN
ncbi:A-kinase anchor protein 200 [Aricia agestis]|uniref:A-kinase anchor protein 200 n=1 Tax=Aricia agestis TaxID=91739 RepID=UPI001C207FC0|nr:A-kinase anchor protein 200 [Aricia agestis]XP_041988556.1 A-kinase anchor protein 200 [Aricia agestis]XP_041988557.1 A-kinase anchor protein 200 [Aricia agestis]